MHTNIQTCFDIMGKPYHSVNTQDLGGEEPGNEASSGLVPKLSHTHLSYYKVGVWESETQARLIPVTTNTFSVSVVAFQRRSDSLE